MTQEKRRVQRITLETPIEGSLNKQAVAIVDLSTTGARVEHTTPLSGKKRVELRFRSHEDELVVSCELVRSRLQRSSLDRKVIVYTSGLRFVDPTEGSRAPIRALVARLVERRVLEQHAAQGSLSLAV